MANNDAIIGVVKFIGDSEGVRAELKKIKERITLLKEDISKDDVFAPVEKSARKAGDAGSVMSKVLKSGLLSLVPELALVTAGYKGLEAILGRVADSATQAYQHLKLVHEYGISLGTANRFTALGAQYGESGESIEQSLVAFTNERMQMRYGAGSAAQAYRYLGIDHRGKNDEDLFHALVQKLSDYAPADRRALAGAVYGGTSLASIAALEAGNPQTSFQKRTSTYFRDVATTSENDEATLGQAGETLMLLWTQFVAVLKQAAVLLAPLITATSAFLSVLLSMINIIVRGLTLFSQILLKFVAGEWSEAWKLLNGESSTQRATGGRVLSPGQMANLGGLGLGGGVGLTDASSYANAVLTAAVQGSGVLFDQLTELRMHTEQLTKIAAKVGVAP